jgi:hypothetical protein
MKENSFNLVCGALVIFVLAILLNQWFKVLCVVYMDKYIVLLLFTIIGISLLPFASKIKIGNVLEIERLDRKIEEVKLATYLGEILRSEQGDIFYFDSDGLHALPDSATATFLRTSKGEVPVKQEALTRMKASYKIDSVKTAEKIKWRDKHIFVVLNGKKYHISSWSHIADWGLQETDFRTIDDNDIKLIPTGR